MERGRGKASFGQVTIELGSKNSQVKRRESPLAIDAARADTKAHRSARQDARVRAPLRLWR